MFLFKKQKSLTHQQSSVIGFVIAVMSLLTTAIVIYGFPLFNAWLYSHGVFGLSPFIMAFGMTLFLAVQGLLLFGFPLHYAQDLKNPMTGLQILVYALLWMLLLVLLLSLGALALHTGAPAPLPVELEPAA